MIKYMSTYTYCNLLGNILILIIILFLYVYDDILSGQCFLANRDEINNNQKGSHF